MYDYIAEKDGKKLRFLIRIEHYVDGVMEEFKDEEARFSHELENPDSDYAEIWERIYESREKWTKIIKETEEKLDKFCELMSTTDKTYQEAEREGFGFIDYDVFADILTLDGKRLDEIEVRERKQTKTDKKARKELNFKSMVYLEQFFPEQKCDALLAKGYKRLKISPFGDSGAAFYWVKTRYNEGKEHAFFCYIIETELKKYIRKVTLNINNGPDLEFIYLTFQ